MSRARIGWAFALMLLIALGATLPLRLFLPEDLISARAVEGSIWSANLNDARLGTIPLGDLHAAWRPFSGIRLSGGQLSGRIGLDGSVSDLNGNLAVAAFAAPYPVERVEFQQLSLTMGSEGCGEASGRVRLILGGAGAAFPPGELLTGPVRCKAGTISAHLQSQSGLDVFDFLVRADRRYEAIMTIRPASPEATEALKAVGLRESQLGLQLESHGVL